MRWNCGIERGFTSCVGEESAQKTEVAANRKSLPRTTSILESAARRVDGEIRGGDLPGQNCKRALYAVRARGEFVGRAEHMIPNRHIRNPKFAIAKSVWLPASCLRNIPLPFSVVLCYCRH